MTHTETHIYTDQQTTLTTICRLGLLVLWGCEGYLKKRFCIWDQSAASISEAAALKSHDLHECGSAKWAKRPLISLSFHHQLVVTTSRWSTLVFRCTKRDYYMTKIMTIHFLCPLLFLMAHKYKYYQYYGFGLYLGLHPTASVLDLYV